MNKFKLGDQVKNIKEHQWMYVFIDTINGADTGPCNIIPAGSIGKVIKVIEKNEKLWARILKDGNRFKSTKFSYVVRFESFDHEEQENEIESVLIAPTIDKLTKKQLRKLYRTGKIEAYKIKGKWHEGSLH